jgi:hypothetical protein
MHKSPAFIALFALFTATAGAASADTPRIRGHLLGQDMATLAPRAAPARGGHALGADMAALIQPSATRRGGHALGQDLAALDKPIGCAAVPVAGSRCAGETIALDD